METFDFEDIPRGVYEELIEAGFTDIEITEPNEFDLKSDWVTKHHPYLRALKKYIARV